MTCGQPSNIMAIRLPKKSLHGFRLLCSAGVLTPPRTFSPVVLDLTLARLWPFTRHNSARRLYLLSLLFWGSSQSIYFWELEGNLEKMMRHHGIAPSKTG